MLTSPHHRTAALLSTALVVLMLVLASVAFAAVIHPGLRSPRNGQGVHAGRITLIVQDRGVHKGFGEYVAISPRRKLLKRNGLPLCGPKQDVHGCDFIQLRRRPHHAGEWTYTASYSFPGYWAVTPGKYYWQAEHVGATGSDVTSRVQSFRVTP